MDISGFSKKILKRFDWSQLLLAVILLVVVVANLKPGYFILGNDNYSPELNPSLSLSRFTTDAGWRSYRALGVASDADQADIYRTVLYYILSAAFPAWLISQAYVFFCFVIGVLSTANFSTTLLGSFLKRKERQLVFFFSGLTQLSNLLTIWIFFSPLNAFMAAWAFLPLVLWRLLIFVQKYNRKNALLLLLAVFLLTTSSIVPTMFFVEAGVILFFLLVFFLLLGNKIGKKTMAWRLLLGFLIVIIPQLPWLLSFGVYVKTNSSALRESYINRMLTPNLAEHEVKYNTAFNSFRYYFSWIEDMNDNGSSIYPFKNWYQHVLWSKDLAVVFLVLFVLGIKYLLLRRLKVFYLLPALTVAGWFLVKGVNPPLGFIFGFLQKNIPLFSQVFRWQSSKFWPLLSTTVPVLSGLGLVLFNKNKKIPLAIRRMFFFLVAVGLAIYVYPLFIGGMIQKTNYVKLPKEYFSLAEFLEKNDSRSRVYISPEANTLYFRQHRWGFWGSSFLNYLLPNPIIERAMTTGSMESESAQKIIENAYYSKDPLVFAKALARYHSPLVISDKTVAFIKNGYLYDWGVHRAVVEENPYLKKIWGENKLSLYRLNSEWFSSQTAKRVSPNHNWRRLNMLMAFLKDGSSYYSQNGKPGEIYPFALSVSQLNFSKESIRFSANYDQDKSRYNLGVNPEQMLAAPTRVSKTKNNHFVFVPSWPSLTINNRVVAPRNLPEAGYSYGYTEGFIGVNGYVFDFRKKGEFGYTSQMPFGDLWRGALVSFWPDKRFKLIEMKLTDGSRPYFVPRADSVVELEMNLEAIKKTQLNFCFWSELRLSCLNPNISKIVNPGSHQLKILIPRIVAAKEKITLFLDPKWDDDKNNFKIREIKVKLYQSGWPIVLQKPKMPTLNYQLTLNPGDKIGLDVPKIFGPDQFHLLPREGFLPEISASDCYNHKDSPLTKEAVDLVDTKINFYAQNCYGGIYEKLTRIRPNLGLASFFYEGSSQSGIPLDIGLKNDKGGRYPWRDRLRPKGETRDLHYAILPEETRSYILDFFSFSPGPRASISRVDNFSFQFIPKVWLEMDLKPVDGAERQISPIKNSRLLTSRSGETIYTLNEAVSSSWWTNGGSGRKVRLDGWRQGWVFSRREKVKAVFWPNYLAYLGYSAVIGLVIFLILKPLKPKKAEKK